MGGEDEDEFWQVALEQEDKGFIVGRSDSEDDMTIHSDDNERFESHHARAITYKIPWKSAATQDGDAASTTAILPLKLSPLPNADGIWSPLGAQAWHASSLLVAYALQSTILKSKDDDGQQGEHLTISLLSKHIESWFAAAHHEHETFTALELGRGAVGLAGIVMGLILAQYASSSGDDDNTQDRKHQLHMAPRVILTDNDTKVVKNLQQNVDKTLSGLLANNDSSVPMPLLPDLQVQHLDWDQYQTSDLLQNTKAHSLQLIFGSELVYTGETAKACANIVLELLRANPDALVFILQVTDRDGWTNVFLPTLYQCDHLKAVEETMEHSELHQLAATIIPPGGTLDRFAFGGCYIFHTHGRVASLLGSS